ncbi:hypothetical protein GIB67_037951 [Kingdonia uniflora]|uniref:Uncharacterized protein n=1 Tax=Kingdonia uniflora TaxID=39325 RepID=A0A7J7LH69_9MAGN|nr:hypothetical protein GIB67_037951 [Kingdonia uniflora]
MTSSTVFGRGYFPLWEVAPHEIVGIHKNEDSAHILHEQDIDENSTQGATEYEQHWHHKEKDVLGKAISVFGEDSNKELWETSAFFLPRAAIGFFTSVATSLFGSHSSTTPSGSGEKIYPGGPSESYEFDLHGLPSESENAMGSLLKKEACKTLHNIEEITELQLSSSNKKAGRFKQFDMVGDLSDHHFVNVIGKGSMFPQVKRGWLKKVHQEWSILQIDLPGYPFL